MALPNDVNELPPARPAADPSGRADAVAVVTPAGSHSASYSSGRVTRTRLDYPVSTSFAWWWGTPGRLVLNRGARGQSGAARGIEDAESRSAQWRS